LIENKIQDLESRNKKLKSKIQNLNNLLRIFKIHKDGLTNNLSSSQIELNSHHLTESSSSSSSIIEINKEFIFNVPSLLFNEKLPVQVINDNNNTNNNTDSIYILNDSLLNLNNNINNELNENFNLINQTNENSFNGFELTDMDDLNFSSNWLENLFENCK